MVRQYPHTGKVYKPDVGVNIDGNWSSGNGNLDRETICRYEPISNSGGGQFIVGQDGEKIEYNCIVYMPLSIVDVTPGSLFEVWEGIKLITRSKVIQFYKGQLNARVWL